MATKTPSTLLAAALMAAPASHALTDSEITAAALVGKTLTFQATNGTGLLPATGTWTGKFENTLDRDFTIKNNGGGVSDHASKYTAVSPGDPTVFSLTSVYEDSGQATLSLSLSGEQGIYTLSCVFIENGTIPPNVITATQGGTFTLSGTVVKSPEIEVREGLTKLADGTAKSSFGTVTVGRKSTAKTYKITNKGQAALKNLKITASGTHRSDFDITPLGAASLAAGKSATFKIIFKPTAKGPRNAALKIASNDSNENPFDVKLSGLGVK